MLTRTLLSLLLLLSSVCALADAELQGFLEQTIARVRDKGNPPAVAALVQINGKVEAQAVVGVREVGNPAPASFEDRWHLGSDTKAMTATMIARLAERGVLGFDDTLAQVFPGIAANMHPALRDVTIKQLPFEQGEGHEQDFCSRRVVISHGPAGDGAGADARQGAVVAQCAMGSGRCSGRIELDHA